MDPEVQAEGIRQCQLALARLSPSDSRFDRFEHAGQGDCHECSRPTILLRKLAQLELCVDCLLRRINAAAKAALPIAKAA
jgi:ribosomal protein S14